MKPVPQSTFGSPREIPAKRGDCFSACLASILELEVQPSDRPGLSVFGCLGEAREVPRFCELDGDDWTPAVCEWLALRGLFYFELGWNDYVEELTTERAGYYVLSGKSPRGTFYHSVVARAGHVVHDPHPSGVGLCESTDDDPRTVGFLVPFDPCRVERHERT